MAQQSLSGKALVEKLSSEFELLIDLIVMCKKLPAPSYPENLELGVLVEEMTKIEMPTVNQWKVIQNYGKAK